MRTYLPILTSECSVVFLQTLQNFFIINFSLIFTVFLEPVKFLLLHTEHWNVNKFRLPFLAIALNYIVVMKLLQVCDMTH